MAEQQKISLVDAAIELRAQHGIAVSYQILWRHATDGVFPTCRVGGRRFATASVAEIAKAIRSRPSKAPGPQPIKAR
ncbi:MAG: hypothetical protein EKK71_16090 [Candidatus Competibacteraceae bacterium]|nr:MAG: hypothetical protein EKK71_16090 [Candidatus Competibacteraceae bacterium]